MACIVSLPLDNLAGGSTTDVSGNANHGICGSSNSIVADAIGSLAINCMAFDGTINGIINVGKARVDATTTNLNISNVFSIGVWVKTATPTDRMTFFAPDYYASNNGPVFGTQNPGWPPGGGLEVFGRPSSTFYVAHIGPLVPANTWTHVGVSKTGIGGSAVMGFFVNGARVPGPYAFDTAGTLAAGTTYKYLGSAASPENGGARMFVGRMWHFQLFDNSLTDQQMANLFLYDSPDCRNVLMVGGA